MWFLGVHYIDAFRWIVGNPNAKSVYATGHRKKLKSQGVDAWDAIQAQVTFEKDIQFTIHVAWVLPETYEAIVDQGLDPAVGLSVVMGALREVGDSYAREELWLPDLVVSANTAQAALPILEAEIKRTGKSVENGTVVTAPCLAICTRSGRRW
jgi:hypothetical protein